MLTRTLLFVAPLAVAAACTPAHTDDTNIKTSAATTVLAPADLVRALMLKGFNDKDSHAIDDTVAAQYVQHNPQGGDGKDALRGMLQYVSPKVQIVRIITDGEFVVAHARSTGWGDGKEYVSFDVFRVLGGKIVEHWDVMQEIAAKTTSGRTQTDGPSETRDGEHTADNKKVVQSFLDDCIYGGNWNNVGKYISDKQYDQHSPSVGDGLAGFNQAMKEMADHNITMKFEKTYRVLGEGNFVFVHSRGQFGGKPVAFADLMRVEGGKIVEHWDAIHPVEAPNKSGHDMFEMISK